MRKVSAFLVAAGAALVAILIASSSPDAQPVTTGQGMTRVIHDQSLAGSGTTRNPLGIRTDCTSTQVLAWDGNSWECAASGGGGTIDGTGTAGAVTLWTDVDTVQAAAMLSEQTDEVHVYRGHIVQDWSDETETDAPWHMFRGRSGRWVMGPDIANTVKSRDFVLLGEDFGSYSFDDGSTTSGSPTLTSASQGGFATAMIGATISGSGIPGGTTVTGVASATSLTMSANASATASGVRVTVAQNRIEDLIYVKHRGARTASVGVGYGVTPPNGDYRLNVASPSLELAMGGLGINMATSATGNALSINDAAGSSKWKIDSALRMTQATVAADGTGRYDVLTLDNSGMATAGDATAIHFSLNSPGTYNTWIKNQASVSSPGFLDPKIVFGIQDTGTTGTGNVSDRFEVTNAGAAVLGALSISGVTTISGGITGLPVTSCSAGSFMSALSTSGTGTCTAATSVVSGTTNTIAKFTSATAVGNSSMTDDGTTVTMSGGLALSQSGDTYIYDLLATSSGNQSLNLFSAGTGLVRINGNQGGVTNAGTGGLIVYPGANSSTAAVTLAASGLGTFVGGVTTPANLTTTGTGDLVSGDALTVAGNATIGDTSASDTHTINGTLNIDGASASTSVYLRDGSFNCNFEDNSTSTCYINQFGYNGGTTQYRNLTINNGNGGTIARFNASTTLTEMFGAATVYGDTTLGDAQTDITSVWGRVHYYGSAPTLSGCTSTCTMASYSTDARGRITCTDDSGSNCTVGFINNYDTNAPACSITYEDETAPTASPYILSVAVDGFVFDQVGGAQAHNYNYRCDGMK